MEYAIAAAIVVLCLGCAYFGYRIGVKNRQSVTVEKIVEKVDGVEKITQVTEQTEPVQKPEVDKESIQAQQNWQNYEPQFNGDKK